MNTNPPINREDLVQGFRQLEVEVDDRKDEALSLALSIGLAVGVAVIVSAYIFGRRTGKRRSTVVEIRRV